MNHVGYEIHIDSLGYLKFRRITVRDLELLTKISKENISDHDFFVRLITNQLVFPSFGEEKIKQIPQRDFIKLIRYIVKIEEYLFGSISKNLDDEEFLSSARKNLGKSLNFRLRTYNLSSILEKLRESFHIQSNLKPIDLQGFLRKIAYLEESNSSILSRISILEKNLKSIRNSYFSLLQKSLILQSFNFKPYSLFFQKLQDWKISEREVAQILKKYNWFVSPSMPYGFIFKILEISKSVDGNAKRKKINALFIDYFTQNNCKNLEEMVNGWHSNKFFKKRMEILRDCVAAIKVSKGRYNPANLVLPVLIAQIDGIRIEYMEENGLSFWSKKHKWEPLFKDKTSSWEILSIASDFFLDILFANSLPGEKLETPMTFNRHKIIHGENLRYGRMDNVIRAFLILDFLAHVTNVKTEY